MVKSFIELYKQYRTMIRTSKVIHLIAPISGPPSPIGWDAIQSVTSDQTSSIILVFREFLDTDTKTIQPRGLNDSFTYQIHLTDANQTLNLNGFQLRNYGFNVTLPQQSSEFITIKKL